MIATSIIVISSSVAVALLAALCLTVRRAASAGGDLPLDVNWIDELSADRYRPMLRLLDRRDLDFLRAQPGFTPKMEANLRTSRCRVFQGYLRDLEGDFARVCKAVKVLMLQSQYDRPDLASELLRQQATFALAVVMVKVRLVLYNWGVCGVEVSALVRTFDMMRGELRTLVPAAAGSYA